MNDADPPLSTMSDAELGEYVRDTAVFRLAVAAAEVDEFADELRENDKLAYRRLVDETLDRQSRVSTRASVESVLTAYHDAISEYAELARSPGDAAQRAAKEAAGEHAPADGENGGDT